MRRAGCWLQTVAETNRRQGEIVKRIGFAIVDGDARVSCVRGWRLDGSLDPAEDSCDQGQHVNATRKPAVHRHAPSAFQAKKPEPDVVERRILKVRIASHPSHPGRLARQGKLPPRLRAHARAVPSSDGTVGGMAQ